MDHLVAIGAQQNKIVQSGFGLAGKMEGYPVMNMNEAISQLTIRRLEVESTSLAGDHTS